ncbi:hypothetical protein CCLMGIMDO_CCLMGIMDO_01548 [Companilactobacillus crustorum]
MKKSIICFGIKGKINENLADNQCYMVIIIFGSNLLDNGKKN